MYKYKKICVLCYFENSENEIINTLKDQGKYVVIRKVIDVTKHEHVFLHEDYEFYGIEEEVNKAIDILQKSDLDIEIED